MEANSPLPPTRTRGTRGAVHLLGDLLAEARRLSTRAEQLHVVSKPVPRSRSALVRLEQVAAELVEHEIEGPVAAGGVPERAFVSAGAAFEVLEEPSE
jgi:hypothetical protein